METLPQPNENARTVVRIMSALLAGIVPGGGLWKEILDLSCEKQFRRGQNILIEAVEKRGLIALDDQQLQYYIPSSYQFFERVRLGEYTHNLELLAQMMAHCLVGKPEDLDSGQIGRAAKRLEFIKAEELKALVNVTKAFEKSNRVDFEGEIQPIIYPEDLSAVYAEEKLQITKRKIGEYLHELNSRGLIRSMAGEDVFGGYSATTALAEIMESVKFNAKSCNAGTES